MKASNRETAALPSEGQLGGRVAIALAASVTWPVLLPVSSGVFGAALYCALASGALGLVLLVPASRHSLRSAIETALPFAWSAVHAAAFVGTMFAFPELGWTIDQITLPGPYVLVRGPVDVLLWLGLFVGMRRTLAARATPRISCALILLWSVVIGYFSRPIEFSEFHLFFDQTVPEAQRAIGLMDIGASVWLSAVLPLSLLRTLAPEQTTSRLRAFPSDSVSKLAPLAMFCGVLIVGLVIKTVSFPTLPILDKLNIVGWGAKGLSTLAWVAMWEEALFRVIAIVCLSELVSRSMKSITRELIVGTASIVLFVAFHTGHSLQSQILAAFVGIASTLSVMRYRNLNVAILGHFAVDVVVGTWN